MIRIKIYALQNLKGHQIIPKIFKTKALAFQYLNYKYPSLYEREDKRGHYLGGSSANIKTLPHSFRVVSIEVSEEDLMKLEDKYG